MLTILMFAFPIYHSEKSETKGLMEDVQKIVKNKVFHTNLLGTENIFKNDFHTRLTLLWTSFNPQFSKFHISYRFNMF